MPTEAQPATAYPTPEQYERWTARADELGMSVSGFITSMVEAGIKVDRGFELTMERDETNRELREQRNDLKDELSHARDRIERLEDRLHGTERRSIITYVEDHPGASFEEIVQFVVDTAPQRVNRQLEELEGEALRVDDEGRYHPVDEAGDES